MADVQFVRNSNTTVQPKETSQISTKAILKDFNFKNRFNDSYLQNFTEIRNNRLNNNDSETSTDSTYRDTSKFISKTESLTSILPVTFQLTSQSSFKTNEFASKTTAKFDESLRPRKEDNKGECLL